ncbi:alkaline phosphatase [Duncaniella muris]|uniref:alkaline phosphatase n=1 Tax=Duncaniella muris TaxID=2094150 RepID=UPI00259D0AC1|nr:alkaline phosphatase [Duncaniella muris]
MRTRFFSFLTMLTAAGAILAGTPKYIFYYIGDGMGMGQVMATEAYNRTVLGNNDHLLMMQFPVASTSTTFSASSPVTDSAAAGTALSTGNKTNNGMLGMTPDSAEVVSVAKTLFDDGFGVGLVTSVAPDDATPGAFYTHVPKRSMYYEIGKDAAVCGYDFIAGSNLRGIKDKKGDPTDLMKYFVENNVAVVRGTDALETIDSRRVVLLNTDSINTGNIGYTIDSIPGVLTLPVMTEACLRHLQKNGRDRFFMMVEGGNIDHASHANDGATVIKETLNFQEALKVAYDFYLAHPDETLIVVTADHETGGMGLGNNTVGYNLRLKYIDYQKMSKSAFSRYCKSLMRDRRVYRWEDMEEYLTDNFGFWKFVPVTQEQTAKLKEDFERCLVLRNGKDKKTLYDNFDEFSQTVFDIMDKATGLGWTTNGHSGGLVPVYAIGVGAEKFASFNDNTDIPKIILDIVEGK